MADDRAKQIIRTWDRLNSDRATTLTHWQQIANYMHPDRADYTVTRTPGAKRMQYVYDSYPIWAREQFRAGCHSFLTSSTLLWFSLVADDDRINSLQQVRVWMDAATLAMYSIFNSARYNFASQSQEVYDDIGTIGTACMAVTENKNGMPLFSTRHMRECCFEENEEDRVDALSRKWEWTADQAVGQWGDKAGEKVLKAVADGKGSEKFWFHHRLEPRRNRDTQRADKMNMAFASTYVSEADQATISEGGTREFVYLTPRFSKSAGEVLGRGPGSTVLPDVKMLNEGAKLILKASQKIIDPLIEMPDDGYILPIRTTPGSILFRRAGLRPDDRANAFETKGNIPIGNEMLNALRDAIGRGFFVDLLHMPTDPQNPGGEGKGSTATYWMQRRDKEMLALSPFLARMNSDWSGPLIERTFNILWRKSVSLKFGPGSPFPPPPAELSGAKFHPEYVSPIAMAQRSSELDAIDALVQRQLQLKQIDQNSPTYLDGEFIMRRTQSDRNAPAQALKSPDQLQQEADQLAQQQQEAAQQAAMVNTAKSAKDGGAAVNSLAQASAQGGNAAQGAPQQEAA